MTGDSHQQSPIPTVTKVQVVKVMSGCFKQELCWDTATGGSEVVRIRETISQMDSCSSVHDDAQVLWKMVVGQY